MAENRADKTGLLDDLSSRWPSLPFMSFGLWSAWSWLAYSGDVWLSDSEVNGINLSLLFTVSTIAFALAFLAMPLATKRFGFSTCVSERLVKGMGAAAAVGSVLVILVGPHWLGSIMGSLTPLFIVGGILTGVGTAGIAMRVAFLYGGIPPRRVLVYASLSQIVGAFVYFTVLACPGWAPIEHGPTIAGIVAFVFLPPAAAALSCVEPAPESFFEKKSASYLLDPRILPQTFWRFSAFAFFLAVIMTLTRSVVVTPGTLASTVEGNNALQFLRVVMGIAVVVLAVRSGAQGIDLGRACSLAVVTASIVTACTAALGDMASWLSVITYFTSSVFEFMMWCLLGFIVYQKHVSAILVFGIGRGLFMLGCGVGWGLGFAVLDLVPPGTARTVFFLVLAGAIIVLWFALFTGRDYDRLFSPVGEDELSLEDLFEIDGVSPAEKALSEQPRAEKRGRFSQAVEEIADEFALSAREADVLRYLAMGYGSDRTAETMGVKVNTVRTHTHNVYVKLGVHSREELMRLVDERVAAK